MELGNLKMVKNKLNKKKPSKKENQENPLKNVVIRMDKFYVDLFYSYCNKYYLTNTGEKYNISSFLRLLFTKFSEVNLDSISKISDRDLNFYTRIGRRKKNIYPNTIGEVVVIQFRMLTDAYIDSFSILNTWYSEKEKLENYDRYSLSHFVIEMLIWLDKGENFKKYFIKDI